MALGRDALGGGVPPAEPARLAVEAEDDELVIVGRRGGPLVEARVGLRQVAGSGGPVCLDGGDYKDLVAPDDGSGAAAAGQLGHPLDVGPGVPGSGRVGLPAGAVGQRAAPVVPVVEPLPVKVPGPAAWGEQSKDEGRERQRSHGLLSGGSRGGPSALCTNRGTFRAAPWPSSAYNQRSSSGKGGWDG